MKKILFRARIALALIIAATAVYYLVIPSINTKIEINYGRDFTETSCTPFELTSKEKDNISSVMESLVFENEEYWGFKSYDESLNLYTANSLVEIAHTLNDNETLDIPDDLDYYFLNNVLKNVKVYDNTSFNTSVMDKVQRLAKNDSLLKSNIDLLTTTYGVLMADSVGFSYNKEKLQNYINQNYEDISKMDNTYDRLNTLYYTIILDQAVNQFKISCDYKSIQNTIDKTLKSLNFKENISNDINVARKALEIVVDLQMHDLDVIDLGLTSGQKNKLRNGMETAIGNDLIMNSVLITDLFIIDKFLEFGLIDNDLFLRVYRDLTVDGGSRACLSEEYSTEIYATSRFFECLNMMNNYSYLEEQKKFVSSLMIDDGLYALNSDKSNMDLSSLLYGNGIEQFLK